MEYLLTKVSVLLFGHSSSGLVFIILSVAVYWFILGIIFPYLPARRFNYSALVQTFLPTPHS